MRFVVGLAFVAGGCSSIWWYKPGDLYLQAGMIAVTACGIVSALTAIFVIAFLRWLKERSQPGQRLRR